MENVNQPIENKIPITIILIAVWPSFATPLFLTLYLVLIILSIAYADSIQKMRYDPELHKYRKPTILFVALSSIPLTGLTLSFYNNYFDAVIFKFPDLLLSVINSLITFIITCIFIHYKQRMYKTAKSISNKIKNGAILGLLYLCFLLHLNSFFTYANLVYMVEQSDCRGVCIHLGVGDLSDVFKENDKYHPVVIQDHFTPVYFNRGFFSSVERAKEDWRFKVIKASEIKKFGFKDL